MRRIVLLAIFSFAFSMFLATSSTIFACGPSGNPPDDLTGTANPKYLAADEVRSNQQEEVRVDSNMGEMTLGANSRLATIQADVNKRKVSLPANACTGKQR